MRTIKSHGFTLIEVMLVVVMIGVLAAMVIPSFSGRGEQARVTTARVDIEANIAMALDMYEMDNRTYPTTEQSLSVLIQKPQTGDLNNWRGPYLKKQAVPLDPWGRSYVYKFPGQHNSGAYDLLSLGPDGIESADDIANWSATQTN